MNFETIFSWFLVLFSMIFSLIFRFVPKPLPETIFGGSKRQSMHKSAIFEPFWDFGGSRNRPLGRHFRPKNRVARTTGRFLERTWARFGAENGPRTHFSRFGTVFGRFWEDFGSFRMDFSWFFNDLCHVLGGIQAPILWSFFQKAHKPQPRKPTKHQAHKPQTTTPQTDKPFS